MKEYRFRRKASFLLGASLAFVIVTGGAPSAYAATDRLQDRVDAVIADFPGGVQTGPGEITWGKGSVTLTLADFTTSGVGNCATGTFCAYSGSGMTGARIAFTSCTGANAVAPLGSAVRSIANGRSSGTVYAYNGTTAVASASPSSYTNTSATITRLGC